MNKKLNRRLRDAGAIIMLSMMLFYLLALISFDRHDTGWLHSGMNSEVTNFFGVLGAIFADFSLSFLGIGAFLLPLICFWQGYLLLTQVMTDRPSMLYHLTLIGFRFVTATIMILSVCTIFYFYLLNTVIALPRNNGGIVGQEIGELLIAQWGNANAGYFVVAIWILSTTLYMRISWLKVAEFVGKYTLMTGAFLVDECLFLFQSSDTRSDASVSVEKVSPAVRKAPAYKAPIIKGLQPNWV